MVVMLCVLPVNAQVMQIHIGEEISSFEVTNIDSITFTPVEEEPPLIRVIPDSLNFGQVVIERQRELMLNISNVGVGLLIIENVDLEEGVFSVEFENPIEIPAGEAHQMAVRFLPTGVLEYESDLLIVSNDMDNEEFLVALFGRGYVPEGQNHYIYEITDTNMSIIVEDATIDQESLVENDEVGVFTQDGLCAGAGLVPAGFPDNAMGVAAWGAEQNMDNGFQADEALSFRLWDVDAQQEVIAEIEVINGQPAYAANGFLVISLSAERE